MSGDSHQDFYSLEVTGSIVKLFCLFSVNPVRSIKQVISQETTNNILSEEKNFPYFHFAVADDYELLRVNVYVKHSLSKNKNVVVVVVVITAAQPMAGTGHKMQIFQRFFVRDIADLRYRCFVTFGSARWLIEIILAILKSTRHGRQGRERLQLFGEQHVLQPLLVYERKFKSEQLEKQICERLLKSESSIVKVIENKSDF